MHNSFQQTNGTELEFFRKKTLWPLSMDGGVQLSTEPLWGDSLLFTTQFPEFPGIQNYGKIKNVSSHQRP